MSTQTFSSTGTKSSVSTKLAKEIFSVEVKNHELLKQAYTTYLSNGRKNLAKTKNRGDVSGGGRKPWRQKGTGRARFGSSRNPIWRGGGVAFGPTGSENYSKDLPTSAKRLAIRQALSLAHEDGKIFIIESISSKDGKTKQVANLLDKLNVSGNVLLVVDVLDDLVRRATQNLSSVKVVQAKYLNVYDLLNADAVIIAQKSLTIIQDWLGAEKKTEKQPQSQVEDSK